MNALAIDLGTTAAKVSVVAVDGRILGSGTKVLSTSYGADGAAEQDADAVWDAVVDAAREALAEAGTAAARAVRVVGTTSQWSSIVPLDRDGRAVGPLVMWFDKRGASETEPLLADDVRRETLRCWTEIHGLGPSTSLGHVLRLQRRRPDIHARTAAYVEPMDYLNARLTGCITATANSAMPLALTDNRALDAVAWSDELVARAGVDASRLPEIVPSMTVIGTVRRDVADALGLAADVAVVGGANDSIGGALGTSALEPGECAVMMGTTGVLTSHHRERVGRLDKFIVAMPSALTDRYYVVAEAGLGGRAIESLLRQVLVPSAGGLLDAGALDDAALFDRMSALAASSPPGARGLLFVPWLLGSVSPAPDDRLRGAFVGMSLATTQSDLLRAALEGVCLQMRWLADETEALLGAPFRTIRFTGGGAQSDTWSQIMADVLGRRVEQLEHPRQANARGAGFLGLLAIGALALGDLAALIPVRATYEPDPRTASLYTERLGVFRDLHGRLAEPSERLGAARHPDPHID